MSQPAGAAPPDLYKIPSIPAPPGITPNLADPTVNGSTRPAVIALGIIFAVITVVLCALRVYIRTRILKAGGWDDIWTVIATICACAYTGAVLASAALVVDVHQWNISIGKLLHYLPLLRAIGYIYFVPTLLTAKIALSSFFLRLFSSKRALKICIWIVICWSFFVSFGAFFWSVGACSTPGEAYAKCSGKSTLPYEVAAGLNIGTDVALLIVPLWGVIPLNMNLRKKIAISLIFLTGLTAVLASCLGLYYRIVQANSDDTTWNFAAVNILSMFEIDTTIIVACLPVLPALFKNKRGWLDKLSTTMRSLKDILLATRRTNSRSASSNNSYSDVVHKEQYEIGRKDPEQGITVQSDVYLADGGRWRDTDEMHTVAPFATEDSMV